MTLLQSSSSPAHPSGICRSFRNQMLLILSLQTSRGGMARPIERRQVDGMVRRGISHGHCCVSALPSSRSHQKWERIQDCNRWYQGSFIGFMWHSVLKKYVTRLYVGTRTYILWIMIDRTNELKSFSAREWICWLVIDMYTFFNKFHPLQNGFVGWAKKIDILLIQLVQHDVTMWKCGNSVAKVYSHFHHQK